MSRTFRTDYQPLSSIVDENDDDQEVPPSNNIQIFPHHKSGQRWNHIEDLDEFFTRIYQYHQYYGFYYIVFQEFLQLLQYSFVVFAPTFMANCVDYDILFNVNGTTVSMWEAVTFTAWFSQRIHPAVIIILLLASCFWIFLFLKSIYNIFKYWEIKAFYTDALKLSDCPPDSISWHEVLRRILEVQKELKMCIHKSELTELDIYNRILRFKNYMIAMVNKSVLPLKFKIPVFGEYESTPEGRRVTRLDRILLNGNNITMLVPGGEGPEV